VSQMLSRIPTPHGTVAPAVGSPGGAPPSGRPDPLAALPVAAGGVPDDVVLETRRGRLLVRFTGEVDTALRARFDRVLAVVRAAREPVLVDCREVTFFCAEGVRMLVLLQRAAGGPGVAEFQGSRSVERALHLSGIDRYPFLD
jgi:anti-anti-sigma regulatory factor